MVNNILSVVEEGDAMKQLTIRLFLSVVIFTFIIILILSLFNRNVLQQNIKEEQLENWQLVESHIVNDMQTVDKAHLFFDTIAASEMEQELQVLRAYYQENPDIYSWDIDAIKARTGMEFYIINNVNKVVISTYTPSIGLDFEACCERFADLLDERRNSDEFFADGLDNSAVTKELWKYSYLSTHDHQYILEFGTKVDELPIFQAFNFFDSIELLMNQYEDLNSIRVLNNEGFILQSPDEWSSILDFPKILQQAYEEAQATNKPTQVIETLPNHRTLTNRFVPYEAEFQRGVSTNRIIYFQYSNEDELKLLQKNTKQIIFSLIFGLIVAIILLAVLKAFLVSTIRRATKDHLTGLYNRSSYLEYMETHLTNKTNTPLGLLVIDLDNFKYINDTFGHNEGDVVLRQFAKTLVKVANEQYAVRFGGDEFALIISDATEEKMQEIVNRLYKEITQLETTFPNWTFVSVSIGGARQTQHDTELSLFMRADKALYYAKETGKNRYVFENC
jgi:diguanylate cyclase